MLLQQLRYFFELSQHRTISQAAAVLNTSQSNLSQTMINLEASLDLVLFHRSNKGIKLTTEGRQVLKHCKPIIKNVQHIQQLARGDTFPFIAISATHLLISSPLIRRFYQIMEQEIELSFFEGSQEHVLSAVRSHRAEIGFIMLTSENNASLQQLVSQFNLELELLHHDQLVVHFRPQHPLARYQQLTPAQLLPYPQVRAALPVNSRQSASAPLPPSRGQPLYLTNLHALIELSQHSNAFFQTPSYLRPFFSELGLVSKRLSEHVEDVQIAQVKLANLPLSGEARLFSQLFREQLLALPQ